MHMSSDGRAIARLLFQNIEDGDRLKFKAKSNNAVIDAINALFGTEGLFNMLNNIYSFSYCSFNFFKQIKKTNFILFFLIVK